MRAGNHQHGSYTGDHFGIEAYGSGPGNPRNSCHPQGNVEQPAGSFICQNLGVRFTLLSLLNQTHDACQSGIITGSRHSHPQAGVSVNRSAYNPIPRDLLNRS